MVLVECLQSLIRRLVLSKRSSKYGVDAADAHPRDQPAQALQLVLAQLAAHCIVCSPAACSPASPWRSCWYAPPPHVLPRSSCASTDEDLTYQNMRSCKSKSSRATWHLWRECRITDGWDGINEKLLQRTQPSRAGMSVYYANTNKSKNNSDESKI